MSLYAWLGFPGNPIQRVSKALFSFSLQIPTKQLLAFLHMKKLSISGAIKVKLLSVDTWL